MISTSFFFFFLGLSACEETPNKVNPTSNISSHSVENATLRLLQQDTDVDATCLEVCGFEARGTVYANCIDDGEDQQECGISARSWYRECLESRCDQAAIDLDDCRTSCRIDKKDEKDNCNFADDKQNCLKEVRSSIHSCIDTCQYMNE